jgi:hypothetical protein
MEKGERPQRMTHTEGGIICIGKKGKEEGTAIIPWGNTYILRNKWKSSSLPLARSPIFPIEVVVKK